MLQSPAKRRKTSTDPSALNQSTPTTPTRASYLSPTKASLARSHPHLVPRSTNRSRTEPRGRSWRNETEQTIGNHDTDRNSNGQNSHLSRLPLVPRQPSHAVQEFMSALQTIKPALVKNLPRPTPAARPGSEEPDLPPTPVQLGLNPAPDRPRGLSSSSPRRSKSGSGRNRRRVRSGGRETSSPSKPQNRDKTVQVSVESEVQEAPESEVDIERSGEPPEVQERKRMLQSLKSRLDAIQAEKRELENAIRQPDEFPDLMQLVKDGVVNTNLENNNLTHLSLFAPGNLQLKTKTTSQTADGRPKIIHLFSITPPAPWPPHVLSAEFEVIIDAESLKVERVEQRPRNISTGVCVELQRWIDQRLTSRLHKLDIGGLIWGIGRYFDECVKRAKAMRLLSRSYAERQDLTEQALLRYLFQSQFEVELEAARQTRQGKPQTSPKLMLTWAIELTWTGDVDVSQTLISTGISARSRQSAQELFSRLLQAQGPVAAFEAVWGLLNGSKAEMVAEKVRGRGRPKRKRIT